MKRIALLVLGVIISIAAHAQLYHTTSSFQTIETAPKIPLKFEFYAKVGANIMSADWNAFSFANKLDDNISGKSKFGVDFTFGFLSHFRPSNPSNFYWGAELSFTQVGGGYDEFMTSGNSTTQTFPSYTFSDWGTILSPSIGWKKEVVNNISLDLHFNPGIFYKFQHKMIECDVVHYNSYNDPYNDHKDCIDIDGNHIKASLKGGIGLWYNRFNFDFSYRHTTGKIKYSNFIISLGYRF